mgnify:CR=1 FL=1
MATFTIAGWALERDINGGIVGVADVWLVVAPPDSDTTFSYSILTQTGDIPDVEIFPENLPAQIFFNGFPSPSLEAGAATTVSLGQATSSQGTHVILALEDESTFTGQTTSIEFVFQIGGDPLVVNSTVADWIDLENSTTSMGPIDATDPFGPGQSIDLKNLANTVQGPVQIQGTDDQPDYLFGTIGDNIIVTGDASAQGDYVVASQGDDDIDMTGMNQSDAFVILDYGMMNEGITATIDGPANTGTVDKGANGTDTLLARIMHEGLVRVA